MASVKVQCFQCGHVMELPGSVGRREECPRCHADVHVCRNCQFYDKAAYNECREPQADVVQEKDRANFCDYYQPLGSQGNQGKKAADLKAAAEALFKKKG